MRKLIAAGLLVAVVIPVPAFAGFGEAPAYNVDEMFSNGSEWQAPQPSNSGDWPMAI
ncbi:MAG TPA: hypothetical protein VF110_01395 [Burkholderiales bacterium]